MEGKFEQNVKVLWSCDVYLPESDMEPENFLQFFEHIFDFLTPLEKLIKRSK